MLFTHPITPTILEPWKIERPPIPCSEVWFDEETATSSPDASVKTVARDPSARKSLFDSARPRQGD
jgi:hypothetical protein